MGSPPTVPFYGKDSDRLAMLRIAHKALTESGDLLKDWPPTVASPAIFNERIDVYDNTQKEAIHGDRRMIGQRVVACNNAGTTWQKIVNYICSTETDHTETLEQMGVYSKPRRSNLAVATAELAPDFAVINLDRKGAVRGVCPRERRRYTWEIWVTEGDPRMDEGWSHKASFGDCTKMDMEGFQSGKEYSFRCRIIGRDNQPSNWSHTITLMVT
jgi:hypothetical protein